MRKKRVVLAKLLALSLLVFLNACSNSTSGSSGSGSVDGNGSLTLGVTDAPIDDTSKVVVEFIGVTLKGESSNLTEIEFAPKVIDLLDLQGTATELILQDVTVPVDNYQWMRLNVVADGTYEEPDIGDIDGHGKGSYLLQENGTKIPLQLSSATGLKLVSGFTVNEQGQTQFTIDFDLRKAIHDSGKSYLELRPALRLIENKNAGHIFGYINPDYFDDPTCPDLITNPEDLEGVAIYLYEAGTEVDDFQSIVSKSPISSSLVVYNGAAYEYAFGFLDAGEYILAMTCDAEVDNLDTDEDPFDFLWDIDQVFVEAGLTTQVDIN